MQQWHTYSGTCLAQEAFSAYIFLAGHARRHICVIARAGSCLQVLILDCSSSTREPVCEPPFTPPGSHYHVAGPSLQLEVSCLGWSGGCRWCHLWHALPARAAPGQLPLPLRSFMGGGSQNAFALARDSPG